MHPTKPFPSMLMASTLSLNAVSVSRGTILSQPSTDLGIVSYVTAGKSQLQLRVFMINFVSIGFPEFNITKEEVILFLKNSKQIM